MSVAKKKIAMPFAEPPRTTNYQLFLVENRCKGCNDCITFCPKNILELDMKHFNAKGYHVPKLKDDKSMGDCAGCTYCQLICPEFAIYFVDEDKKSTEKKPESIKKPQIKQVE